LGVNECCPTWTVRAQILLRTCGKAEWTVKTNIETVLLVALNSSVDEFVSDGHFAPNTADCDPLLLEEPSESWED
jgi:hypothetical protein